MSAWKRMCKGISEMLAVVLGVAITIAIGVALFTILPNYITSMSQQQRVAITYLSASKVSSNSIMLTLAVKNLGSKDITNISIYTTVNGTQPAGIKVIAGRCRDLQLAPGQETALTLQVDIDAERVKQVQVGMPVTVVITVTYVDRGTAVATATTYVM